MGRGSGASEAVETYLEDCVAIPWPRCSSMFCCSFLAAWSAVDDMIRLQGVRPPRAVGFCFALTLLPKPPTPGGAKDIGVGKQAEGGPQRGPTAFTKIQRVAEHGDVLSRLITQVDPPGRQRAQREQGWQGS